MTMDASKNTLLHDFCQTLEFVHTAEGACQANLALNPAHPIFDGHFPELPVVPGVCMMQMTKELLERAVGRETRLVSARNIRFLLVLNPNENKNIRIGLSYRMEENGSIHAESTLSDPAGQKVFFKMKGTFRPNSV